MLTRLNASLFVIFSLRDNDNLITVLQRFISKAVILLLSSLFIERGFALHCPFRRSAILFKFAVDVPIVLSFPSLFDGKILTYSQKWINEQQPINPMKEGEKTKKKNSQNSP